MGRSLSQRVDYQDALFTPGSSPLRAFNLNWNYESSVRDEGGNGLGLLTLDSPNSVIMPRPFPEAMHRSLTVVGRVYLPKVFNCN